MSNNIPQIPYPKMSPFYLFMKKNFPFVEGTYEANDLWNLFCKLVEHFNQVEGVTETLKQNLNSLYEYLNNLDLQDEVNNKLDEMAEDGTLSELIGAYITNDIIRVVTTRAYLKTMSGLEEGMKVKTLGCYEIGDGGNGYYIIKEQLENETFDESFNIELENDLKAELIIEDDKVNFKTLGARSLATDNTLYDNKTILENFVTFNETYIRKLTLYIPGGVYGFTETNIASDRGFNIEGVESFSKWKWNGTIFVPINSNQSHIIKIGNGSIISANISLKNITFSTANFEYNSTYNCYRIHSTGVPGNEGKITASDVKQIITCLDILHLTYATIDNINFQYIRGKALTMSTSWEINFGFLNFRCIENYSGEIINMLQNTAGLATTPNISACRFKQINAEGFYGDLIKISSGCSFANNTFDLINIEPNYVSVTFNSETVTTLPDASYNDTTATHFSTFNLAGGQFTDVIINNIQVNNYPIAFITYNNTQYVIDRFFSQTATDAQFNYTVNNISVIGQNKDVDLLYFNGNKWRDFQNCTFNNFTTNQKTYRGRFNVNGARNIHSNIYFDKFLANKLLFKSNTTPVYEVISNVADRNFGSLHYDVDSINPLKLVHSLIPTSTYPTINRKEIYYELIGTKVLFRCKIPTGQTCRIITQVLTEDGTSKGAIGATAFPDTVGDGEYHWYTIDVSSLVSDDLCGYKVTFYQPDSYSSTPLFDVITSY